MNTIKKIFIYVLIIIAWICNGITANPNKKTPGADNWMTANQLNQASQLSEAEIKSMSTEELINVYLDSRFTSLILAYDNPQEGFNRARNDFNGLRELLNRADAAKTLIDYYRKMDPGVYNLHWEPAKIGRFTFYFIFIEVLLVQEEILTQLSSTDVKILLFELLKKNESKVKHQEQHSIVGLAFNAYSIAKLIQSKGKHDSLMRKFLDEPDILYLLNNGRLRNEKVLSTIIQKAQIFLQSL